MTLVNTQSTMCFSEEIEGNPWSVIPIKTRLYAKDTTEIVLSSRKITKLVNFSNFENLEALWLNSNKLKRIEGLNANFRLKVLILSNNLINTLEGSLSVMKFLQVLFLDGNKLRKLETQLDLLKELPFLENLNLFSNPISEEPEYRLRVIYNLKSLKVFDRHKIGFEERLKSDKVVPEFNNAAMSNEKSDFTHVSKSIMRTISLSKRKVKKVHTPNRKILMTISKSGLKEIKKTPKSKMKKVYEKSSITEKEMFIESKIILEKYKKLEITNRQKEENQLKERALTKEDVPHNKEVERNKEKYLSEEKYFNPEIDTNEMRRLFKLYDPKEEGIIKKKDLEYLFIDIKDLLKKEGLEVKERKFYYSLLQVGNREVITVRDVKEAFNDIIHETKVFEKEVYSGDNIQKDKGMPNLPIIKNNYISDIDYAIKLSKVDNDFLYSSDRKEERKPLSSRRDIFSKRLYNRPADGFTVILNENKLEALYR